MTVDLDRLADEVAAALPRLDANQRRVGVAVYRLMAAGQPASPEHVASLVEMPVEHVATLLQGLPTATVTDGAVTAFLGLQSDPGRHRLLFDQRLLATWCAWDTLFLPGLIGRAGRAESHCPVTGDLVTVEVDPVLGVTSASPEGALLSFLAHPEPFEGDVIVGFCRWVNFLGGAGAAEAWISAAAGAGEAGRPEVTVLSLTDGVELGRRTNAIVFGDGG